jgi:aryl-alcohol dehydrogenase-like predicted oxidoreductase
MKKNDINRRRFLLGLAGAPLIGGCATTGKEEKAEEARIVKYNTLGKTGLKVSDISLGAATEASVLHYAYDRGINLYDTAEQYNNGQHEVDLGKAFKTKRDKVIVINKHLHGFTSKISRKDVIDRFDASLKRMDTDYIDIAMIHHLADTETIGNEELMGAYETLKKQGKFRHFGFSTHDTEKVCPAAIASGLFEVMLVIYNGVQYPNRSEMITRARESGIGVLAMKTMAGRQQDRIKELVGEKTTFSQAAIKWALTDPSVDSVLISMRTFEHIDEYLPASGKSLTEADGKVLEKYTAAVDQHYCRIGCTACQARCPHSVAVNDIMRFGMYYENYGEEKQALQEYAALDDACKAEACRTCSGECEAACPHRLSIRERLVKYDHLLRA